ncbi:MAG: hypothetical protein B6D39_12000 [Anaerolineae bacterium UTCFX2]|jgi:hypothetical protein|nr:hypothetical protein [Anaerolineales bacterium]OQY87928.1 MAG: hypothetical protein B6D39_12000 [Anaerolineae bacterium UTCFX2]
MELLLFILIAGVAGYLLARSRLSKPIDDTTEKVADTTRKAAASAEDWVTRTVRGEKKAEEEIVDVQPKTSETAPTAAKQSSRRHADEDQPENEGSQSTD